MHNLTQRQIEILKAVIEEYIQTADPVGSETIEKKYNLSASPATIRNEMVKLSEFGYLEKPHSSSGRVPTASGMRFYVRHLMRPKELTTAEEVTLQERVWDYREKMQKFLKEVTRSLADKTGALAIAATNEGDIYVSGYANILEMPEFFDIDITKTLLSALDEYEYLHQLCHRMAQAEVGEEIYILMGDELGQRLQGPYSLVYTTYETTMHGSGEIGVLGPLRLNYTLVVPTVRYFGNLIEQVAKGW